ncbi:MAG: CoA transferase [Sphingorhabdus sp.]
MVSPSVTVIELAEICPAPFCSMLLVDHGARVICIEWPGNSGRVGGEVIRDIRNRRNA